MQLIASSWQVITTLLVFLVSIIIATAISKPFRTRQRRSVLLYLWHTIFCVIYALYVIKYKGDALYYYQESLNASTAFSLGTESISFITIFFTRVLGLSFLGTFFAYSIFGFMGLLAFDASLRAATAGKSRNMRRFATVIVLLPSISFWSSAIGKDSLAFMATGFALWAALNLKHRTWLMIVAILTMLLVRPHIAGIMIVALAASQLIQRGIPMRRRLLLGGTALAASAVMVPLALNYAGLVSDPTSSDVVSYIEQRQQYNQEGGGGIDISSMSLPMQLITYLFRPLPFEASSLFSLAASVDNVVLLLMFLVGGRQILKRRKPALKGNRTFLWLYSLLAWVILAVNTANMGISMRQKWMVAPMLIFLLISLMGKPRRAPQRPQHATASKTVKQLPPYNAPPFHS